MDGKDSSDAGSETDVRRVKVTHDKLKATALKLERLDDHSRQDLYERRTPAGRGSHSVIQNELRTQRATKGSRILSNCAMLASAVKAANASSVTSSRKVLSMEEQRELNTQRRLARHGLPPAQSKTKTSVTSSKQGDAFEKVGSSTTHGVLSRGITHSSGLERGGQIAKNEPAPRCLTTSAGRKRPDPAAKMFRSAFASALLDHQPEDEDTGSSKPVSLAPRRSLRHTREASGSGGMQARIGLSTRPSHSSSAGILASPLGEVRNLARGTRAGRVRMGVSSMPSPMAVETLPDDDEEEVGTLRITVNKKRRQPEAPASPGYSGSSDFDVMAVGAPKRPRISSIVSTPQRHVQ